MALTVADIAKKAFDGVSAKLSGVIKAGTLQRKVTTGYDAASGTVGNIPMTQRCRLVFGSADAGAKYFPGLVIAAPEQVGYIEGAGSFTPQENDTFIEDGQANRVWTVRQSRSLLETGGLHISILRPA